MQHIARFLLGVQSGGLTTIETGVGFVVIGVGFEVIGIEYGSIITVHGIIWF